MSDDLKKPVARLIDELKTGVDIVIAQRRLAGSYARRIAANAAGAVKLAENDQHLAIDAGELARLTRGLQDVLAELAWRVNSARAFHQAIRLLIAGGDRAFLGEFEDGIAAAAAADRELGRLDPGPAAEPPAQPPAG